MPGPSVFRDPTLIEDDERLRQTGSIWTASALMITAVIGSVVLSLAWAVAQLGLVAGPIVMFLFFFVTYYTCSLLTYICHRSGDTVTGSNNYTYLDLIHSNLGWKQGKVCGLILNVYLLALAIGCTTAVSKIMMEMTKSICLHARGGHTDSCRGLSSISYMNIVYGIIQIIISQLLPYGFEQTWYSVISGGMFFTYGGVSIYLSIREVVANGKFKGSLRGIGGVGSITEMNKFWRVLQAIGVIAFACSSYSTILIETQGRVKSEAKAMKKATLVSITVTTIVYMFCGCMGYIAFGDLTPEDLLLSTSTSIGHSGFYWLLIDIANTARVIHLTCACQAYCQPIYALVEKLIANRLRSAATNNFIIRLVWRTAFVVLTNFVSVLMLPFFKDVVGLVGALGFWCLAVYFPVEMHISQKKTVKWTLEWVWFRTLSVATLVLSLAVAVAYGHAILVHLKTYKPFRA